MYNLKQIYKNEIKIKPISLLKSLFAIAIYILVQNIISLLSVFISVLINPNMSFGNNMILVMIVTVSISIAMVILAGHIFTEKGNTKINNNNFKPNRKDYLHICLIIIGYILIREAALFEVLTQFEGPIPDESIDFIIENSSGIEFFVLSLMLFLQTLIEAPIFEELFFRGILLNGFLSKYKINHKKAIIYSAIIFAIAHLNIPQGINAFILGVMLGYIYYYTKSMKLSIFAHFINNLIIFIPVPSNIIFKIAYICLGLYCIVKGLSYIKQLQEKNNKLAIDN